MQQPAGRNGKTGIILHDIGTVTHKDVTSEAVRIFECSALIRSALHQVSVLQIRNESQYPRPQGCSLQFTDISNKIYCLFYLFILTL